MKLEQSFQVSAPIEEVWSTLIDIERVAPCLPGAEITDREDDGTYRGDFKIKLGPTTAAYRGTLRMESLDESAHVATLRGEGQDKRGQGSAKATVVSRMTESGGVTTVDVVTDLTITGKLARFGRGGMIKDVSNRLMGDFARCLQAGFEGAPTGASEQGSEPMKAAPVAQTMSTASADDLAAAPPAATAAEPTEAADDLAAADASPAAGSQVPPVTARATRGGGQASARSAGQRAAVAPASEGPGRADQRTRFEPPAAAQPVSGLGVAGSILLARFAPVLLPVVRVLISALERFERALVRESGR